MNYYMCVHSQAAIDLHNEKASRLKNYIDLDIPRKYICGTMARNNFSVPVINAYDGNPVAKYNKILRQFTSLHYLINRLDCRFHFSNCSCILKTWNQEQQETGDIVLFKDCLAPRNPVYYEDTDFKGHIDPRMSKLLLGHPQTKHDMVKFYKDNFGFDLYGSDITSILLWCTTINCGNPCVKQWFNETLEPFLSESTIKYFNSLIIDILLAHTYKQKYMDKIKVVGTRLNYYIYSHQDMQKDIETHATSHDSRDLHYYGR